MKKQIFIGLNLSLLFVSSALFAQFEAKINPFGTIFGRPELSVEYLFSNHFGTSLALGTQYGNETINSFNSFSQSNNTSLTKTGFSFRLAGKYYLNPRRGGDVFYIGSYIDYINLISRNKNIDPPTNNFVRKNYSAGFMFGYKLVSRSGIIYELGTGIGKIFKENNFGSSFINFAISDEIGYRLFLKFSLGYRF